jgi:hypothetical protein
MSVLPDGLLIAPDQLARYGPVGSLADRCGTLLAQQRQTWELLRRGYDSLPSVRSRTYSYDGFRITTQFNPGRIISSSAKVDEKSIKERKCFLCAHNLPAGQRGFLYGDEHLVLGNPFPIFPEHLTIPHVEHRPQRILPILSTFLALTREVSPRYSVVYNGPRCGASAPDHMHIQLGTAGTMHCEEESASLPAQRRESLAQSPALRVSSLEGYLRTVILLEARDEGVMEEAFRRLHGGYQSLVNEPDEPLMNLVSFMREGRFVLAMFARSKHRPSHFFAEGEAKMLLSPAAVDVGGVVTLPLEKDFERVSADLLAAVFGEVSLGAEKFAALKELARRDLRGL